jgi:hypothetical protein
MSATTFATVEWAVILGTAIYHLVMGSFCLLSLQTLRKVTGKLYALDITEPVDPKLEYGMRPLGAFALTVGSLCLRGAVVEDASYRTWLSLTLIGLFLLRASFRLLYRDLFARAFNVDFGRNVKNITFNAILSSVLGLACAVRNGVFQ